MHWKPLSNFLAERLDTIAAIPSADSSHRRCALAGSSDRRPLHYVLENDRLLSVCGENVAAVEAAVRLLLCHDHYLLAHIQRLLRFCQDGDGGASRYVNLLAADGQR